MIPQSAQKKSGAFGVVTNRENLRCRVSDKARLDLATINDPQHPGNRKREYPQVVGDSEGTGYEVLCCPTVDECTSGERNITGIAEGKRQDKVRIMGATCYGRGEEQRGKRHEGGRDDPRCLMGSQSVSARRRRLVKRRGAWNGTQGVKPCILPADARTIRRRAP